MNTHPLAVIERLIDDQLRTQSYTHDKLKRSFIPTLRMELDTLLWDALHLIELEGNEQKLTICVQFYQCSLLRLMDSVANHIPAEEQQRLEQFNTVFELQDCYKVVFSCLQKYLVAMDRSYSAHINIDSPVPLFYLDINDDSMKASLRLIRDKLSNAGMDGYWTVLRKPLNELLSTNGGLKMSYMKLAYLKRLHDELMRLLPVKNKNLQDRLQYLLMRLDFNDTRYVSYVIELMNKEIDKTADSERQLALLGCMRLDFTQILPWGAGYIPSQPTLNQQLTHWVEERMTTVRNEPYTLKLEDLDPDTAKFIQVTARMEMSDRQLKQYLKVVVQKEQYKRDKEKLEYLFSLFCKTVPEDNPSAQAVIRVLRVATMLKKLKSRLWF